MIEQINPHRPHHFYVGVILAVFGFRFVWPFFPRLGVAMTSLGMAIALDDVVTHATGRQTVLDALEKVLYRVAVRLHLVKSG